MLFFTVEKIAKKLAEIRAAIHREAHPIGGWEIHEGPAREPPRPAPDDPGWRPVEVAGSGAFWGGYDVEAWFRTTLKIPAHLHDRKLALRFLVGPRDATTQYVR